VLSVVALVVVVAGSDAAAFGVAAVGTPSTTSRSRPTNTTTTAPLRNAKRVVRMLAR
jgi:hypothetical protein